jgi:hypothetical protein
MNPQTQSNQSSIATEKFQHLHGYFVIDAPCILCNKKIVYAEDIYGLLDFTDNGGIIERAVKFFDAYIKGYNVTIVVLDLKTGEMIKRKHRLNNDSLPCDWVLIEYNFLNPKNSDEQAIKNYCNGI